MSDMKHHIGGFVLGGIILVGAAMLFGGGEPEPEYNIRGVDSDCAD